MCTWQAYAKLQYNPGRELLEAAGRRALAALHQYTPQVRSAQLHTLVCSTTI